MVLILCRPATVRCLSSSYCRLLCCCLRNVCPFSSASASSNYCSFLSRSLRRCCRLSSSSLPPTTGAALVRNSARLGPVLSSGVVSDFGVDTVRTEQPTASCHTGRHSRWMADDDHHHDDDDDGGGGPGSSHKRTRNESENDEGEAPIFKKVHEDAACESGERTVSQLDEMTPQRPSTKMGTS